MPEFLKRQMRGLRKTRALFKAFASRLPVAAIRRMPEAVFYALLLVVVFFHFNDFEKSHEVRIAANREPLALLPEQEPGFIEALEVDGRVLALRKPVVAQSIPEPLLAALQFMAHAHDVAELQPKAVGRERQLTPILHQDGFASPRLFAAISAGEPLDITGAPVRWRLPDNLLAGYSLPRSYPVFLEKEEARPAPRLPQTASSYRALVENFARRFDLSVPLVMAIIHSESDFSPALVSPKSAMGLMQLLPSTASGEVHRFLYGKSGRVGFEDLRVPEINIRYGTAYLHILLNRYFPLITDREVREICAIAAYNLGPNRFVRLYGPTPEAAAAVINSMGREAFLNDLPGRLPTRETRSYVEKVRRMRNYYAGLP